MNKFIKKLEKWWETAKIRWKEASGGQRAYAIAGAGVVVLGVLVGGALQQAVFTGLIFNMLLWMMLFESPWAIALMRRWGTPIDLTITLAGFLFGGGGGVTALMVGVVVGALFSVFRVMFCGTGDAPVPSDGSPEEVAS